MERHARKVKESCKEAHKFSETNQPPATIIDLSSPVEEEIVIKQRKGKEKITEKLEVETLKEKRQVKRYQY